MPTDKHQQHELPRTGYVRLNTVLALYPVGRSTWYRGVVEGRFPKPVALSARTKGYPVEEIKKLIETGAAHRRGSAPSGLIRQSPFKESHEPFASRR